MRLDLFVKVKYQSRTMILFVGIRYSMRDLLSDINNCLTRKLAICLIGLYGKLCHRFFWHQLALESCEFHSKTIF